MKISSAKTCFFIVIFALVFLHIFSFGPVMSMEIDKHGQMPPCPFLAASSICTMSSSNHLSLWKSVFAATVDNEANFLAIMSLMILSVVLSLKCLETDRNKQIAVYRFYARQHSKNYTFNKLIGLFSQGILNPKIYDSAVI